MPFKVKDTGLAKQGKLRIEWAESRMPVLMKLRKEYSESKPLSGMRVGGCLHITTETVGPRQDPESCRSRDSLVRL